MRRERALGDERSIAGGLGMPITRALMMLAAHSARGPRASPAHARGSCSRGLWWKRGRCGGEGRACGVARSEWDGQLGDGRVGEPEGSGNGGEEREGQDELGEEADQAHPTNRCNHNLYYSASLRRLSDPPRVRMHIR